MNITISYEEMGEVFVCNHKYNQIIYSRYIQYKVHYHRIFTRDKLLKMKIIDNDSCLKCQLPDRIEHLFINCEYSKILWTEVQKWIDSIGFFQITKYITKSKFLVIGKRNNVLSILYCYLPNSAYTSTGSLKQVQTFTM